MSRIVAFAWTTPALLFGKKTCTRRDWNPDYARSFKAGQEVFAYNRSQRFQGVHVATIRLTEKPTYEPMIEMPDSDYDAEGLRWLRDHESMFTKTVEGLPRGHFIRSVCTWEGFASWRVSGGSMYVVRFELLSLTDKGKAIKEVLEQSAVAPI